MRGEESPVKAAQALQFGAEVKELFPGFAGDLGGSKSMDVFGPKKGPNLDPKTGSSSPLKRIRVSNY